MTSDDPRWPQMTLDELNCLFLINLNFPPNLTLTPICYISRISRSVISGKIIQFARFWLFWWFFFWKKQNFGNSGKNSGFFFQKRRLLISQNSIFWISAGFFQKWRLLISRFLDFFQDSRIAIKNIQVTNFGPTAKLRKYLNYL